MASPESPKASVYHVLRNGKMSGPFTEAELEAGLEDGRFEPGDFIQDEDYPIWQPISRAIGQGPSTLHPSSAPDWKELGRWIWYRFQYSIKDEALVTGAVLLAVGAVILTLVLANWTWLLWLPFFAAALIAGINLIRREQPVPSLALLVGAVVLPFFLFAVIPHSKRQSPGTSETLASVPASPAPAPSVPHSAPQVVAVVPQRAAAPAPATPLPDAPEAAGDQPGGTSNPPAIGSASTVVRAAVMAQPAATPALARTTPPLEPATPPTIPALTAAPLEPATASAPATPPASIDAADLVQRYRDSFIVINGREGSGSGFVCRVNGTPYLFTNIHVVADITQPAFTRLNGTSVRLGPAAAAVGHDILRFSLPEPEALPLEAMTDVPNNLRLDDEVVVLGNSGGGGVVTSIKGKVVGIGPDRIEVNAEFIPGNSGSPIIHARTGKVIGVATYLTSRYEEFSSSSNGQPPAPAATPTPVPATPPRFGNRPFPPRSGAPATPPPVTEPTPKPEARGNLVVRRFGYRLDSIRQWEPVNWAAFRQDREELRKISLLTEDVIGFLRALRDRKTPEFNTPTLQRSANDWFNVIRNKTTSDADRTRATASFLGALRTMVRGDVTAAENHVRYSYFREDLSREREVRDRLYTAFNSEAQKMASPR